MEPPAPKPSPAPLDRLLDCLVCALANRHQPGSRLGKLFRLLRRGLAALTALYFIALVILLAGLEWRAERHWLLSFLLFLPAHGWLLPLALLTPPCLLLHPRLCLAHLAMAMFVLVFFMGFEWSFRPRPGGKTVTLVTNNTGENGRTSATAFAAAENADIIVLQDAYGRGPAYAGSYSNRFVAWQHEFVLVSRWPVKNSGVLPVLGQDKVPLAAWFELDCEGRPLMIYSLHLPTPRHQLENMKGLGFLAALAGREGRHGGRLRGESRDFWTTQTGYARAIIAEIEKDNRPFLIAGDFNVPNHGVIYHLFAEKFTDAFAKRGRGYGFSFPGFTRDPFTLFGPWLRLDQVWSGPQLRPLYCAAEPDRKSQHRAVVARFEFAPVN